MAKKIRQIAIYGKGGIGKSTTTSNLSAALSVAGFRVMQFGCDPKADSTSTLRNGSYIPTVLDTLREKGRVNAYDVIYEGFNGIYCVEAGGPAPGVGCAGRGIITAVELFRQQRIFEELDLDYVIYDVLGDVVCGGFAVPIREGIAQHVFTVSSGDFMSIYASNNLFKGIKKYSNSGGALLGGIIANSINHGYSREIIDDFAARTKTQIMQYVPALLPSPSRNCRGRPPSRPLRTASRRRSTGSLQSGSSAMKKAGCRRPWNLTNSGAGRQDGATSCWNWKAALLQVAYKQAYERAETDHTQPETVYRQGNEITPVYACNAYRFM